MFSFLIKFSLLLCLLTHLFSHGTGQLVWESQLFLDVIFFPVYSTRFRLLLLQLLLLFKKVGSARLRESDIHPFSSKTPAPQYQPIDRKRKEKRVEDYSRDRAV